MQVKVDSHHQHQEALEVPGRAAAQIALAVLGETVGLVAAVEAELLPPSTTPE